MACSAARRRGGSLLRGIKESYRSRGAFMIPPSLFYVVFLCYPSFAIFFVVHLVQPVSECDVNCAGGQLHKAIGISMGGHRWHPNNCVCSCREARHLYSASSC